MIALQVRRVFACLAMSSLGLAGSIHAQGSTSCVNQPAAIVLANRATLAAETRLYEIESASSSTLKVEAFDVDLGTGEAGPALWRTHVPAQQNDQVEPATTTPGMFDAVLIGPPRSPRGANPRNVDYARFMEKWSERNPMVYLALQDGRLFSLNARTGHPSEIPTAESDLNERSSVGTAIATADVQIANEWRTMLVAFTGQGPSTLLSVDVTDPQAPQNLWSVRVETGEGHREKHQLAIVQSSHGWSVMFTAGDTFYIYNAITGAAVRTIQVDSGSVLTDPALVDLDRDGIAERAYAGDMKGNVWRFDLSSPDPNQWRISFDRRPLVDVTDVDGFSAQVFHRPEVVLARDARTPIVLFTARSNSGVYLLGARDRDRPIEPNFGNGSQPLLWRRSLSALRTSLDVSMPLVHDGHVVLVFQQTGPGTCEASTASLSAFSFEDGEERISLRFATAKTNQAEHSGLAGAEMLAGRPIVLDQASNSGHCLRHYYLGSTAEGLLHQTTRCPSDTFGRQSWRQLR